MERCTGAGQEHSKPCAFLRTGPEGMFRKESQPLEGQYRKYRSGSRTHPPPWLGGIHTGGRGRHTR